MPRLLFCAAFTLCLTIRVAAGATVAFEGTEIRVPAGSPSSFGVFLFTDDPEIAKLDLTSITDHGPTSGNGWPNTKVVFDGIQLLSRSAQRADWKATITATDLPPRTTESRKAVLTFGATTRAVTYTITNMEKTFTWTLTAEAKDLVAPPNDAFSITIVPASAAATNLSVSGVSMRSDETQSRIGREHIQLCKNKAGRCETPSFPAGVATPAYVRFKTCSIPNGTYAGSIDLRVDESAQVASIPMTFSRTTTCAKSWGAGLILMGVFTSLFVTMFSRQAIAIAEALIPAARLRELVTRRRARLTECGAATIATEIVRKLDEINGSLSTEELRKAGYVAGVIRNPFAAETTSQGYATFLQSQSVHLTALGYLIDSGFCRAAGMIDKNNPAHVAAREKAFRELDKLDTEKQTPETLAPEVKRILGELQNDITATEGRSLLPRVSAGEFPSTEQLLLRISRLSGVVWLIWMVITMVTGYLAMIVTDPGFGTPMDYAKCFLWGLGVQIAGQQLQNLTPASVTSALNITAPKS